MQLVYLVINYLMQIEYQRKKHTINAYKLKLTTKVSKHINNKTISTSTAKIIGFTKYKNNLPYPNFMS